MALHCRIWGKNILGRGGVSEIGGKINWAEVAFQDLGENLGAGGRDLGEFKERLVCPHWSACAKLNFKGT